MALVLLLFLGLAYAVYQYSLRHALLRHTKGARKPADTIDLIHNIERHSDCHETAAVLNELIHIDGAGSWPPRANHAVSAWPAALRPYKQIYLELAPFLPQQDPCLDDQVNMSHILHFRSRFETFLRERIDLVQVRRLLDDADAGRWDVFPRAVYNAFYCCIASSRHAYRWGMVPVVRVAQLEREVTLPTELVVPWQALQQHFGCSSDSGNNTSNMVLNFDLDSSHIYKANTGMPAQIETAEENFARIFHETEVRGLPVYHDMVMASLSWARNDKAACANYVSRINSNMRHVLNSYFNTMHNSKIMKSVWLSHVQGFFGWGVGFQNKRGEWIKFDGLSGNQSPLFQALDAFLGLEPYLSERDQERNVPARQRKLRKVLEKHSFRRQLSAASTRDEYETRIWQDMDHLVKQLRVSGTYLDLLLLLLLLCDGRLLIVTMLTSFSEPPIGYAPRNTWVCLRQNGSL